MPCFSKNSTLNREYTNFNVVVCLQPLITAEGGGKKMEVVQEAVIPLQSIFILVEEKINMSRFSWSRFPRKLRNYTIRTSWLLVILVNRVQLLQFPPLSSCRVFDYEEVFSSVA